MGDGDMSVVDSYLEPVDGISGQYIVALGGLVSVRFGDNSMGFNQGATVTEFIPAPVQANKSV